MNKRVRVLEQRGVKGSFPFPERLPCNWKLDYLFIYKYSLGSHHVAGTVLSTKYTLTGKTERVVTFTGPRVQTGKLTTKK